MTMNEPISPVADTAAATRSKSIDPPSVAVVYLSGVALLLFRYTAVFALTLEPSVGRALGTALGNVVPLAI